ncbi:MAG: glycosyltransferase family 2 protein [Methanobacterium sp.]|nr:glycosyltransferase family 2 protein [Methanobacterium sp.]
METVLNEGPTYPRVAFIVLNWNGWQDTIECLKSVDGLDYPNYHMILVDNASHDDSIHQIRNYYNGSDEHGDGKKSEGNKKVKNIKNVFEVDLKDLERVQMDPNDHINSNCLETMIMIKNDENYGFTGGNNIALKFACQKLKPDYYLLLNNDTIVDPHFLINTMESVQKYDNVGFAGPKIYYHNPNEVSNLLSFTGGNINLNTSEPHPIGKDENDRGQYDNDRVVDYIEGSCMLVSRGLGETVGFFNEDYFTYWEEIDWCIRGKKAGFKTIYTHNAKIWHKCYGSDTGALSIYYMIRNRFLFMRLNETMLQRFTSVLYYFFYFFWKILISLSVLRRDTTKLSSFLEGTKDGIKNIKGPKKI